jgi:hypothetical protein
MLTLKMQLEDINNIVIRTYRRRVSIAGLMN